MLVGRASAAAPAVAELGLDERLVRAAESGQRLASAGPDLVEAAVAELGQPRRFAERELSSALEWVGALPELAAAIRPRPVGAVSGETVLQWMPYGVALGWHAANSPLWVPTVVVLSALVAGNAVLSRPSQRAARTTGRAVALLADAWPVDAVVTVELAADDAEPLLWADGVGVVVAHGSTTTCRRHLAQLGRAYAAGARLRPYIPEASGNDAALILAGADLQHAATAVALGGFANGGQLCMAAKRIIVERSVWSEFAPRLVDAVEALVVGDPSGPRTDVAPVVNEQARSAALGALSEALARGGRLVAGGLAHDDVIHPTIVQLPRGALDVALWREEVFAPVRGLVLAADADDAVRLANDTSFGLGAAVFGGPAGVAERLRAARVLENEGPLYADPQLVVGGIGDSGFSGARPKVEQLVWARRVHRSASATRERGGAASG